MKQLYYLILLKIICWSSKMLFRDFTGKTHRKHNQSAVHSFLVIPLSFVKSQLPCVQKVIYFCDGAASQCKNYKAFFNLCFHEQDHSLKTEWHFFATSHSKRACDGVERTVKCPVANGCLKAQHDECILTPMQLYEWTTKRGYISFIFVQKMSMQAMSDLFGLYKWYSFGSAIDGSRSHHSFIQFFWTVLKCEGSLLMIYFHK